MDAYVGEIRMFAGNFPPVDWAFCDGQILSIQGNEALFSLIGNRWGGDGQTNFALPDLRGRVPVHQGTAGDYSLGGKGGVEQVTLTANQVAPHTHTVHCQESAGKAAAPTGGVWAISGKKQFSDAAPNATMAPGALSAAGAAQVRPHDNMMPYLPVSFIICLNGLYPTRD